LEKIHSGFGKIAFVKNLLGKNCNALFLNSKQVRKLKDSQEESKLIDTAGRIHSYQKQMNKHMIGLPIFSLPMWKSQKGTRIGMTVYVLFFNFQGAKI